MADTTWVSKVTQFVVDWTQTVNDFVYRGRNPIYATSTGAANVFTVTHVTNLKAAFFAGDTFTFKAHQNNTGACTFNFVTSVGTLSAAIQLNALAPPSGTIVSGQLVTLCYDGTAMQLQLAHIPNLFVSTAMLAGSAVTTGKLNDASVTYAKIQNVAASSLVGNATGAPAVATDIALGQGLSMSSSTLLSAGLDRVMGCKSSAPGGASVWTLSAAKISMRNPSNGTVMVVSSPANKSVDLTASGAGGLDTGTVANTTFYHMFWIAKADGTLNGIASVAAPNTGPALPSGYIFWAYDSSCITDGSAHYVAMQYAGSKGYYAALRNVLANGVQVAETAITISGSVPATALSFVARAWAHGVDAGVGQVGTASLRWVTGVNFWTGSLAEAGLAAGSFNTAADVELDIPNASLTLLYITVQTTATTRLDVDIVGFQVPNGS